MLKFLLPTAWMVSISVRCGLCTCDCHARQPLSHERQLLLILRESLSLVEDLKYAPESSPCPGQALGLLTTRVQGGNNFWPPNLTSTLASWKQGYLIMACGDLEGTLGLVRYLLPHSGVWATTSLD